MILVHIHSEVSSSGGRVTLSSGRDVVSLTLSSSDRGDAGSWTCTAQVYEENSSLPVGEPVLRSVQLVVVGKTSETTSRPALW